MKSLSQFLVKKRLKSPRKNGPPRGQWLLRGDLDEKTVLYITRKVIEEEYGKKGAENVVPKRYKDKTLFINALQSVWANEIVLEKERLCVLLNKKLGKGGIQEIRVQGK